MDFWNITKPGPETRYWLGHLSSLSFDKASSYSIISVHQTPLRF